MRCPNCGQENRAGAAFCLQCGTQLGEVSASGTTATSEPSAEPPAPRQAAPTPPVSHEPGEIELTHRGHVFGAGYGADFYGVWDLRVAGEPVARFERTPIGWEAAWRKFQELDSRQAVPVWRRPNVGWIILHILIGFVVLGFVQAFVIGGVLVAFDRATDPLEPRTSAMITVAAFIGLVAWLLFVYLNRDSRVRWAVFLTTLLSGFAIALVVSLVAQPAA
jgi:zinc ribbon protein